MRCCHPPGCGLRQSARWRWPFPEDIETLPDLLSKVAKVHERRLHVLRFLAGEAGLVEPSWIFAQTGANNGDLKMLSEAGLITLRQAEVMRDPLKMPFTSPKKPPN